MCQEAWDSVPGLTLKSCVILSESLNLSVSVFSSIMSTGTDRTVLESLSEDLEWAWPEISVMQMLIQLHKHLQCVHTGPGTWTHTPPRHADQDSSVLTLTNSYIQTPALWPLPPYRPSPGAGPTDGRCVLVTGFTKATASLGTCPHKDGPPQYTEAPPEAPLCLLFRLGPASPSPSPGCQVLQLGGPSAPSGSSGPPHGDRAA